jgi:GNAT superfamily N-acetyltransferase
MSSVTRDPASVVVRPAAPGDAAMLADLGARAFAGAFAADNTPEDMEAYLREYFSTEAVAAEIADPNAIFLVAELGGAPAGYAKLHSGETPKCVPGPSPIELVRLYALQEWLGAGVGAALMRAALDAARARGYGSVWLGVWERNTRAIAFYSKWGFEDVGTKTFVLGSDEQTDRVMARDL